VSGRRIRTASAIGLALVANLLVASLVLAATPTPGPAGDPRSAGEGPGLVGDPAFAVVAVLVIGLGTVLATLAYVRMTGGRRS
jgi:hypothetical protein